MNSLFILLGIESWKPVLTALLLPPVPLLLMVLVGARLILPRRGWGWTLVLTSVALLWLSACSGTAGLLSRFALQPPQALDANAVSALRAEAASSRSVAIVVLGGGMEPYAPEYGAANLSSRSLERLRYGVWLGRQTNAPVAFSGGVGWGQANGQPEARIAAQIAAVEWGRPLQWIEDTSRDTRANALHSVALLKQSGISHIVLVTHGSHMPRAQRAFEAAAGGGMRIQPAPIGLVDNNDVAALTWLPSSDGFSRVRNSLRELVGRRAGA